ncbi:MAG: hypothetical protein Hyperionvirus2_102 [Hyperionvirus sp.]|uniref:Uncharacterized protein n=1 Tax=Hyperionvirus sp. TaxID=2487770 RepID=A0A3G5A881_9VIRU|nr:MAG: hypothetical protein Hyperionvirus2_102 [Hyperionvirus sp.]
MKRGIVVLERLGDGSSSLHREFQVRNGEDRILIENVCVRKILLQIAEMIGIGREAGVRVIGKIMENAIMAKHPHECPDLAYGVMRLKEKGRKIVCYPPVDLGGVGSAEEAINCILEAIDREHHLRELYCETNTFRLLGGREGKNGLHEMIYYPKIKVVKSVLMIYVDDVPFRFPSFLALLRFMSTCLVDTYDGLEGRRIYRIGLATEKSWSHLDMREKLVSVGMIEGELHEYFAEFTDRFACLDVGDGVGKIGTIKCYPAVDIGGTTSPEEAIDRILDAIDREYDLRKWFESCYSVDQWITEWFRYPTVKLESSSMILFVGKTPWRFSSTSLMLLFMSNWLVDTYDSIKKKRLDDIGICTAQSWSQLSIREGLISDNMTEKQLYEYFEEFTDYIDSLYSCQQSDSEPDDDPPDILDELERLDIERFGDD